MKSIADYITSNPAASDADVAALKNADPSRFKPVGSPAVLEWLGTNGRKVKLDRFVASQSASEVPQILAAVGAVQTVLIAAGNPNAYLSLEPGSGQVALLIGLVAMTVLDQADADALIGKAKLDADVSEADVAAERVVFDRRAAAEAALAPIRDRWNAFNDELAVYVRDGGAMPTWEVAE